MHTIPSVARAQACKYKSSYDYAVIGPQSAKTLEAQNSAPRSSKTITLSLKH